MERTGFSCSRQGCRLPDTAEDLVECDKCKNWWHLTCAKYTVTDDNKDSPWFCGRLDCVEPEANEELDKDEEGNELLDEALTAVQKYKESCGLKDQELERVRVEQKQELERVLAEKDKELARVRAEKDQELDKLRAALKDQILENSNSKEDLERVEPHNPSAPVKVVNDKWAKYRERLRLLQEDSTPSEPKINVQSTPKPASQGISASFHDSSSQQSEMSQMLVLMSRQHIQELPTFFGDNRREWPYFEEVFKSTTVDGRFNGKENVARLRKALKGQAYELVSDRLKYSSDADAIMDSLREVFGRADVLIHELTQDLLNLPKLSSCNDPKLRSWAVKVNGFVADVKSMNRAGDLVNEYVMTSLAAKLGDSLYKQWQRKKIACQSANLEDFAKFLSQRVAEMQPELMKTSMHVSSGRGTASASASSINPIRRVMTHHQGEVPMRCVKCNRGKHLLTLCDEFKLLTPSQRYNFAKEKRICFICLDPQKHDFSACSQKKSCGIAGCARHHHRMLHWDKEVPLNSEAPSFAPQSNLHAHAAQVSRKLPVMFKIVPIRVFGKNGKHIDTFAFLDDGSELSMIEKELYDKLELDGVAETLHLKWTKGVTRKEESMRTSIVIKGQKSRKRFDLLNVYSVEAMDLPSQSLDVEQLKKEYQHLRGLPLESLLNAKPQILIGLSQAKFLLGHSQRHGKDNEPVATKTLLGWVVFGNCAPSIKALCYPRVAEPTMRFMFHESIKSEESLHDLVKRHFTTEEFGVMAPRGEFVSKEVARAVDVMETSLKFVNNRYEIGLLWKSDEVKLPDSFPMAMKRLEGLERSLKKKPDLLSWLNNHMQELIVKGYARIASEDELKRVWPRVWYTPTFVVINPNKSPPKPRMVADVAAKVNGVSLNTHLLKGPDYLVPLHAGLFKFRERAIAVNADVKEMFHQVVIKEEDQQCQRMLWRNGDTSRKSTIYIMQVMMFGPTCSPTCAQFVKNHHANLFLNECPEAVDGLTKRTYVDDYFNSHDSVEESSRVLSDAIRICKSMSFDLVGVQSNSRKLLDLVDESHVKPRLVNIDPNECEGYTVKVLGMHWDPTADFFTYTLKVDEVLKKMLDEKSAPTKREMLRTIMRIFDPLGLISNYIIRGRIILQEVWREGCDWDEAVPYSLAVQWREFIVELKNIEKLKLPRRYVSWNPDDSATSLVVFVDASEKAFAAVAYLRFESVNRVEVVQVMAKAKVAPVKQLSIPRLELQAAMLGVRVASVITESHSIKIDDVVFLSDSKTVLAWINSATYKFPSFVAVRVGEILNSTTQRQWFHVKSADNVADDGTKWIDPEMGNQNTRWFNGPDFLKTPRDSWPITPGKGEKVEDILESTFMLQVVESKTSDGVVGELKARFQAKWVSSVRVIAFLLRFKDKLRKIPAPDTTFVTPDEFKRAERWMFRSIQREAFPSEVSRLSSKQEVHSSSSILSLNPFLDEEGTIRLSSRSQKAKISYAAKNPAILPKSHPLVDLLVQHHHERNFHMGTTSTITEIRQDAWIISIRRAVERVKSRCMTCKLAKAKPVMPLMGQLPEARVAFDDKPFTHVGIDCFGPLLVKFGRGTVKRYGMIFTCLTFRAVQVELLNDLSLDQCLMAVRRFIINRVVTRFLYSDNGLNFIGAKNVMAKDIREMEKALSDRVSRYEGILWRFIPAYSPWMGGAWERLIQSIKKTVEFILRDNIPREDVLRNALIEAQGQINRRPLTHLPVDPEDPKPLTPNSMLFGEDDRDVTAPGVFTETDAFSKLFSRRAQHLTSSLVARWYTEYLPEITRRSKWYKNTKPIEVDDVVIIVEPNEIRSAWQLGRVVRVFPAADGVVRQADVKLPNGKVMPKRSAGRLAVLDLKSSD